MSDRTYRLHRSCAECSAPIPDQWATDRIVCSDCKWIRTRKANARVEAQAELERWRLVVSYSRGVRYSGAVPSDMCDPKD